MAHATWYPTGGDWTYIESVCNLYEAKGHCIIPFAMHHEKNLYTPYNKYFLSNIDYKSLNESNENYNRYGQSLLKDKKFCLKYEILKQISRTIDLQAIE